jgi:outer membrane lipase/esterase
VTMTMIAHGVRTIGGVLLISVPLMVPHWMDAIADAYGPTQQEINQALLDISTTPNTASTAGVIAIVCPQANETQPYSQFTQDCNNLVAGALAPKGSVTYAEAVAALTSITANQATLSLSSSRASLSTQLRNLLARLVALRGGAAGISLQGLTIGGGASADQGPQFALGDGRLGVFVNGAISTGDKDPTENEEGFDFDAWGITAGIDYRFRDNLIAGIAGGYSENDTDIDNSGGSLDTDGYSISLYGTYYHDGGAYADAVLTYGHNDYDQKRNIRYSIDDYVVDQTASADYNGSQWSGAVGVGYDIPKGPWTFGPVVRLQYVSADVDGYSEEMSDPDAPGGGWAASLDDMDQESFTTTIGGNVSRAVSTQWGVLLPQLHLSWVHEFKDDAISVNGTFIQDPTNSAFDIQSDNPDSDYFNARLGISAQFAHGNSAFLFYNKVFGYNDLDLDSFGAGVRLEF